MMRCLFFCAVFLGVVYDSVAQCASGNGAAVFLDLDNPSFEGTPANSTPPKPWKSCDASTVDTQPNAPGIELPEPASKGNTYMGIMYHSSFPETVGAKLNTPMKKGVKYNFTIDIMQPKAFSGVDITLCAALEIYGSSSECGRTKLLWTSPSIPPNSGWGTYAVTFTPDADYPYVTFRNHPACGDQSRVYLGIDNISEPLPIEAKADSVTCYGFHDGKGTVLKPTGAGYKYEWKSLPAGTSAGNTVSIKDLHPGKYMVIVTNPAGNVACDTVEVKEPTEIKTTATKTDVTVYAGSDGTATVTASGGTPAYKFAWSTSPVQTTAKATNLKAGVYTCVVTDKNGCTKEEVVIIKQPDLFKIVVDTVHVLCFGQKTGKITLHVSLGKKPYSFAWSPAVAGNDSIASNLPAGMYECVVTDISGASVTEKIIIKQPTQLQANITAVHPTCNGNKNGEAAITVTGGVKAYQYSWSTTPAQTTPAIKDLVSGTYTCTVTDANGCTLVKSVPIVDPLPLTATTAVTHVTCNGYRDGSVVVHASGGTRSYTYALLPGTSFVTDSNFTALVAGTYTVAIKDVNACTAAVSFTVTEPAAITIDLKHTNVSCNGASDGSATVTVTGATAAVVYSWAPGGATTASITNVKAGDYVCTITYNNGCITKKDVKITQPDSIILAAIPDKRICQGQTVDLTASASGGAGDPFTYTWNNGAFVGPTYTVAPTKTTSYTVIAKDKIGCESPPVVVKVTVSEKLKVIASDDMLLCKGSSVVLSATASGGDGNYTYEWLPAGTGSTATVTVTPAVTTRYTVSVTDGCNSPVAIDTVNVTVIDPPEVDFVADTLEGCPTLCVKFKGTATVKGDVIKEWKWEFGDGQFTTTPLTAGYCYGKSGFYTVSLTVTAEKSRCFKKVTKTDLINVYPKPKADFDFDPKKTTLMDPKINFYNKSKYAISWDWNFGDKSDVNGNISDLENPFHVYPDTGNYCIKLLVKSDKACSDEITKCLRIAPDVTIYVPNAFTPNKSGRNDYFNAKATYIHDFEMWIYDRWGMLTFHTTNINDGWNGSVNNNGNIVQQDVYVYKIRATDTENKKHELIGTVTLIR